MNQSVTIRLPNSLGQPLFGLGNHDLHKNCPMRQVQIRSKPTPGPGADLEGAPPLIFAKTGGTPPIFAETGHLTESGYPGAAAFLLKNCLRPSIENSWIRPCLHQSYCTQVTNITNCVLISYQPSILT